MIEEIVKQAKDFRFYGIQANIDNIKSSDKMVKLVEQIFAWEKTERTNRKFKSSIRATSLHKYAPCEPVGAYDWNWPRTIDKQQITELFTLQFINDAVNVIFFGPSGVGKTNFAKNLVEKAATEGKSALFKESADLLDELLATNSKKSIRQLIDKYAKPDLLAIDEVGYLSYDTRHADVLFQLVQKRAGRKSTLITTNRPFSEWGELFPNAASVSALIDRLIERCEIVQIDGDTYRGKRFKDRKEMKANKR